MPPARAIRAASLYTRALKRLERIKPLSVTRERERERDDPGNLLSISWSRFFTMARGGDTLCVYSAGATIVRAGWGENPRDEGGAAKPSAAPHLN